MATESRNIGNAASNKRAAPRPGDQPEVKLDEESILRLATIHLLRRHGGLLVASGLREERSGGARRWIITVTLRHPTGHEGYIGDLLYDGKDFEFLTPPDVRKARARQIAADPEGTRRWNEYRASSLPTGEE
jgi:hypothetical protein